MDALQRINNIRRSRPKLGWSRNEFLRAAAKGKARWQETERTFGVIYAIFADAVAQIDSSFGLPAAEEMAARRADVPALRNVDSRVAVWFMNWERCAATRGVSNPYEPWVEIWEHGGGFSVEHGDFVDVYDQQQLPVGAVVVRRTASAEPKSSEWPTT